MELMQSRGHVCAHPLVGVAGFSSTWNLAQEADVPFFSGVQDLWPPPEFKTKSLVCH